MIQIIIILCFFIVIFTFVLMMSLFILMVRLGLFVKKGSDDSMSWEEFKTGWNKFEIVKMLKNMWKMTFKW